jgi:osomolarity two-component system response regulator SKN7
LPSLRIARIYLAQTWAFRHSDFRRNDRNALENIKRKSQRISSAATAVEPPAVASSSQQVEIQNSKIVQLESQLTALGAAHRNVLTSLRTLERSNHEVILEMIGFQRNLAQQDGLLRALLQYLWRDNVGISSGEHHFFPASCQPDCGPRDLEIQGKTNQLPANDTSSSDVGKPGPLMFLEAQETQRMLGQSLPESDVARATLQQMSELSHQAQASGISFSAIESGGTSNSTLGVSGTSAAMDGFNIAGIELQALLQGNAIQRLDDPLSNLVDNTPRNVPGATGENLNDLEDEVVLPTPMSPPISDAQSSRADTWAVSTGDTHEGLEVFTVGHLMPRGTGETGSGSFESGALVGNQEASGDSAQTLRVRRSTFVPGWAVPPRVLLVDDDAVTRKLSSKFLKIFGCTTDVAVDGVSAVNKMNLEKYDLVLMVRFPLAYLRALGLIAVHAGYRYAQDGRHLRDVDDKEIRPANTHHFDDEQLAASGNYDLLLLRCVLLLSSPCTFADRAQA